MNPLLSQIPWVPCSLNPINDKQLVSMSNFIYRQAYDEDVPSLAQIRAIKSATREHWLDRIHNYSLGLANPQDALAPRIIYLALDSNKVVGFVAGHLTRRLSCQGELQWIDTVEAYRRKGIASNLIRMLAKWFIEHQAYKICVDPGDQIARKFYQTNGAISLNEHWLYWDDIRNIV